MSEHSALHDANNECEFAAEKKPVMTPERRSEIIQSIRKKLPLIAEQRRDDIRKIAKYSKLCILDAFQGRLSNGLANNSKKSKWIYTIFQIQTSELLLNIVLGACILHICSLFIEPPNACPNSFLFKIFQFCIYLIYVIDIALKMSYEGVEEYFKHEWQRLYCANAIVGLIDLFMNGCTTYCNPLRPVAGVLRSRKGRKFFDILKKMIPDVMYGLVPIFFFAIVVMIFGNVFFDSYVENFHEIPSIFYNWLYLILTNDTFDRLLPENLLLHVSYLLFFFPAIYIGQRFLLNLIIGDTYDTFRSLVKKQLKKERLKEIQGLTKAFSTLDDRKTGFITAPVWQECISALHPELSLEAIALYYEIISGGNNNISVLQFLSLRSVLDFHVKWHDCDNYSERLIDSLYETLAKPVVQLLISIAHYLGHAISDSQYKFICQMMKLAEHYVVWEWWNMLDLIVLFMGWHNKLLPYGSGGGYITIGHILLIGHAIELFLRLLRKKGNLMLLMEEEGIQNNITMQCYLIGCIGTFALSLLAPFCTSLTYTITLPFLLFTITYPKVHLVFHLLRCSRIVCINEGLDNFTSSLFDILPSLIETFTFTFIVSYMFGTLGHLLFGQTMTDWNSPLLAIVKAQQLTFMVSFLDSMEAAMTEIHPLVTFYFLFFLIVSMTVSNIALSMIIDLHSNLLAKNTPKERENERKKLDIMFTKLVNQARTRKMLSGGKHVLNFKHIKMSAFQSSDVRKYITSNDSEAGLQLKDLEQCQKYANIHLIDFYHKMHKNEKSIEQEIVLLKDIMDMNLHTELTPAVHEIIFEQNTIANQLFIVINGTVLLTRNSHYHHDHNHNNHNHGEKDEAVITATHFLGLECFLPPPNTTATVPTSHNVVRPITYSYSCMAEKDTKILCISQENLLHQVDSEVLGPLLKAVMRSTDEIHSLFDVYRKKINLRKSFVKRRSSSVISVNSANGDGNGNGGNSPRPHTPSSPTPSIDFNAIDTAVKTVTITRERIVSEMEEEQQQQQGEGEKEEAEEVASTNTNSTANTNTAASVMSGLFSTVEEEDNNTPLHM